MTSVKRGRGRPKKLIKKSDIPKKIKDFVAKIVETAHEEGGNSSVLKDPVRVESLLIARYHGVLGKENVAGFAGVHFNTLKYILKNGEVENPKNKSHQLFYEAWNWVTADLNYRLSERYVEKTLYNPDVEAKELRQAMQMYFPQDYAQKQEVKIGNTYIQNNLQINQQVEKIMSLPPDEIMAFIKNEAQELGLDMKQIEDKSTKDDVIEAEVVKCQS